jgi:uncharacterized protein
VQLRGHHFLCILTYRGYGYTPAFVENMSSIVAGIEQGRPVRLVDGPDDICGGLTPADRLLCNHDCSKAETRAIDSLAVAAVRDLLPADAGSAMTLDAVTISELRRHFATHAIRAACRRCSWSEFCTTIAAEDFGNTKLFNPSVPSPSHEKHLVGHDHDI